MRIERKIVRTQVLRSLVIRKIIEQNGAQDGALGFHVCGKTADAVVGGGHACLGYFGLAMATSIAKLKRKSKCFVQKLCTGPDSCGRPSIKRALPKLVRGP